MKKRLYQLLGLRPGEAGLVLMLGALLLSNSLALAVSNVVSVSGFLSEVGVNEILIVWIVDMLLVILATGLQSLVVDRFERLTLLRWMSIGFALVYLALRLMFVLNVPGWLNYSLLFVLTDQQWLFFPLIFWILANDIFDMAQSKRLFPLIASGSFVGQILGLGISAVAPRAVETLNISSHELLSMNVLIYVAAYVLVVRGLRTIRVRQTTQKQETVRETLLEGWGFVREVPSFRYLMLAMLLVTVGFTIVEFHLLVVSDDAFSEADSFQTFYSLYNMGAVMAAIVLQGLLTSRIINRFTLKNTFLFFPFTLLGGVVWMLALPGVVSGVLGVAFPRLIKETIDETTRKSFQALVPEERRGRVSMFMDSYLFAGGAIIGSLVLVGVIIIGDNLNLSADAIYLPIAALATVFTIWFTFRMRDAYDASLLNWRLKRRQRGSSGVLDKLDF